MGTAFESATAGTHAMTVTDGFHNQLIDEFTYVSALRLTAT